MSDRKDPFFRDPPRDGGASGGSGGGASPRRPTRPVPDDASIPVLTERLTLPPVDLDFTLPVAPESREPPREFSRTIAPLQPTEPPPPAPRMDAEEEEPPPPSPFVHFSMNSPVGRSFPAAPTFAPPVPPLSTPPPAAVSLGSGAAALPVPPAVPPSLQPSLSPVVLPSSTAAAAAPTTAPISVASSSPATPTISATPTVTSSPTTGAHWARIELELRESILRQVAERLPHDVEAIVHRHMASALEEAIESATTALVARVAAEARLALASSLREIVDHAVRAELDRLRGLRR